VAAVTGKGGTVTYDGGSVASIGSWSIDVDTNMHDITSFTTSAVVWRSFADGLSGFSGGIDGVGFDPTSTGMGDMIANTLTPTKVAAVFEIDKINGGKLSGDIWLDGAGFGADIDGLTSMTFSVLGDGAVAFTTST
jgi:hypothetical protein